MYVRLARFEGGRYDDIRAESEQIRAGLEGASRGEESAYFPKDLVERVSRVEFLVDRESGSVAMLLYCESEGDAREVDSIMDRMSPQRDGWGKRASREIYEVAFDHTVGARRAA
jgi:hypothetical protein